MGIEKSIIGVNTVVPCLSSPYNPPACPSSPSTHFRDLEILLFYEVASGLKILHGPNDNYLSLDDLMKKDPFANRVVHVVEQDNGQYVAGAYFSHQSAIEKSSSQLHAHVEVKSLRMKDLQDKYSFSEMVAIIRSLTNESKHYLEKIEEKPKIM